MCMGQRLCDTVYACMQLDACHDQLASTVRMYNAEVASLQGQLKEAQVGVLHACTATVMTVRASGAH